MARRHMPVTKRSGQTMGWSSIMGDNVTPRIKQSTKATSAKSFGLTTATSSKLTNSSYVSLKACSTSMQSGLHPNWREWWVCSNILIRKIAQSQSKYSLVLSGWQERLILCILVNQHVIHRRPYQQSLWPYQTSLLQQWWKMWIEKLPAQAHATEIFQSIGQVIFHSATKKHVEDWWC